MELYKKQKAKIAGQPGEWWLNCIYVVAQKMISLECTKGGRVYPSSLPLKLLKFAANQGHVQAKMQLGQYLFESGIAKADKRNGLEYLRQAAKRDEPKAQFLLGQAFLQGCDVVAQDNQHAAHWLALAADSGHGQARQLLEIIQQNEARMRQQASADGSMASKTKITKSALPA